MKYLRRFKDGSDMTAAYNGGEVFYPAVYNITKSNEVIFKQSESLTARFRATEDNNLILTDYGNIKTMYVDNKLVINNEYKFETRTFTVDLNDLIPVFETYQFNYEKCISGPVIKKLTITSSEEILDTDSFFIVYFNEYNEPAMDAISLSTLTDNFPTSFYKRIDANTIELSLNPYEVFGGSCCMLFFTHSLNDASYIYATEQTYTGVKIEEYIRYVTVNNGDLTLSADGSTVEFDSNSL